MIRTALITLCLSGLLFSFRFDSPEWPLFQALAVALFALAVVGWVLGRFEISWSWALAPMIATVVWPVGQLLFNTTIYRHATLFEVLRWSAYTAIFVLSFWLFRRRDQVRSLFHILIIYSLVFAVLSTMEFFAGNGKVFWVFTTPTWNASSMGPFMNRDHYASFMALIVPLAILGAFDDPKRRLTYILSAAAMYASVVAGASRAGSLVVTIEILVCLSLVTIRSSNEGSFWQRHRISLATIFLVAALVAVVGWEPLLKRFQEDDPYKGRRELAMSTVDIIRERPWVGTGLGTWIHAYPAHALFDPGLFANAAHNDWLQWASDGGIPFAAVVFVLFCMSVALCWKAPWVIGLPAVFIHCTVDFPLHGGRYLPALFFLIFGAALGRVLEKRRRREHGHRRSGVKEAAFAAQRNNQ
jgi:O-antigen ligase